MVRFDLAVPADVRFGAGRVSEVPDALVGLGASRVLVVTGRTTSRADAIRSALSEAGLSSVAFGVATEPSIERVRAAMELISEAGCDAVLGFGGGSPIDVAKAAAVLATSGTDPLEHLEVIGAGRPILRPGLPCVAVPTTAGTGSEVTRNSVLSGGGVKASLRSPLMLPKVAVVDPDLLVGLPSATIAASGMDALSQLIEPLLSQRANPFSDALARDGIRRSARSLRRAYEEGMEDAEVREDLALASLFGGMCLANSGLGAVHGIAAAAGARLSAPHGAVCAAVLAAAIGGQPAGPARPGPRTSRATTDGRGGDTAHRPTRRNPRGRNRLAGRANSRAVHPRTGRLQARRGRDFRDSNRRSEGQQYAGNPIELSDAEVTEIVTRSL